MPIISTLPYNIQNGTVEDATQVMANFNQIVTQVNANSAKSGVNSDITSLTNLATVQSAVAFNAGITVAAPGITGNLTGTSSALVTGNDYQVHSLGVGVAATGVAGAIKGATLALSAGASLAGTFTNSAQPGFDASLSVDQTSGNTVIFDTVTQVGTGYNRANGLYTAPNTGRYVFAAVVRVTSTGGNNTTLAYYINNVQTHAIPVINAAASTVGGVMPAVIFLNSGDFIEIKNSLGWSASAKAQANSYWTGSFLG